MSDTAGLTLSLPGTPRRDRVRTDAPQLFVALECSRPSALSARYSMADAQVVKLGRGTERAASRRETPGGVELSITIPDRWMSSRHAVLERGLGRWVLRDTDSKNGCRVNGESVGKAGLRDGDVFELGHTLFRFRDAVPVLTNTPLDCDLARGAPPAPGLTTLIPELTAKFERAAQVARSEIPILIEGESGTGKELLARAIHQLSARAGAIVAVNCGAIPDNLVESELFGHRKGAFSGAVETRPGLIRAADTGTLFLDEIGDLPASSQAALLRVLQEREVTPVGDTRPVPVDLRVVAATHHDLDAQVAADGFRRDLFARLTGFRITLPALAERIDDLGLLIGVLHGKVTADRPAHPGFEPDAARLLFRYDWPLNIRELEQTLATAAVLAGDDAITAEHLPDHVRDPRERARTATASASGMTAEDVRRRDEIVAKLRQHRGNVSAIARDMGKDRKQIQRWLKRYGLDAADFRAG